MTTCTNVMRDAASSDTEQEYAALEMHPEYDMKCLPRLQTLQGEGTNTSLPVSEFGPPSIGPRMPRSHLEVYFCGENWDFVEERPFGPRPTRTLGKF